MRQPHAPRRLNGARPHGAAEARHRPTCRSGAQRLLIGIIVAGLTLTNTAAAYASNVEDQNALGALDTRYQKAVETNDYKTMAAILADSFILVEGDGKRSTKSDLLKSATDGKTHYEHQVDSERTIIVFGDTAIVSAKLWAKGLEDGAMVDYTEWFSDVYVRTPRGWNYVFGQASLPLPKKAAR